MGKYTVYLCDICKKEIRQEKEYTSPDYFGINFVTASTSNVTTVTPEIEMCQECQLSFEEWKKTRCQ